LDDLANDNTKRHSILARQILVFKKQEITQTAEGRMIQVNYSNMMKYKETMLPGNVVINISAQRKISN
jgi:hypothetical protein